MLVYSCYFWKDSNNIYNLKKIILCNTFYKDILLLISKGVDRIRTR